MAKTFIPGLSFVPDDGEGGEVLEIPSFRGTVRVPELHRYGNCQPREYFDNRGTIYQGKFGTIYQVADKTGQIFALKKFHFTPEMMKNGVPESFLQEVGVLKILKHENIVNAHATVVGKLFENNYLLMDYCFTSLHELIEKNCDAIYESDVVKYIMKQLFEGLSYIHECLVIHRHISCRNLLFTESGTLKISGFRTARFYDPNFMTAPETEMVYRAPELLYKTKYGLPVDTWSAGCVFAHLLLKQPLFTGENERDVLKSIFSVLGTPSEAIWPGYDDIVQKGTNEEREITYSQPFADIKNILVGVPEPSSLLLQDMLLYFPKARFPPSEVKNHPFILDTPRECSAEKMRDILERTFPASRLLDSMQVDD